MPRAPRPTMLLALALAALLTALWLWPRPASRPLRTPTPSEPVPSDLVSDVTPAKKPGSRRPAGKPASSSAACRSHAAAQCHEGDAWWLDGCGELEEPREDCGPRLCANGACEPLDAAPCAEPLEGRCDGANVRLCIAGRAQRVDCARLGLTCLMGAEGAECAPEVPRGERCAPGPARCEGELLVRCEAGRRVLTDCVRERAQCEVLADTREAACVSLSLPTDSPCGACGCGPEPGRRETACDGRDDDGNRLIDEGLDCGAVPIVAFIVTAGSGYASHGEDDVAEEVARVNQLLAGEAEAPFQFVLDDVVLLPDERLLTLTMDGYMRLADDARLRLPRSDFYVPVLFTDRLESEGGVPRVGVSTLPNGTCGGVHWGRSPELGLVAVAKGRAPTTVAHELGHFLGLCHTHEVRAEGPVRAQSRSGQLEACGEPCLHEGDGICDTPPDPGPELCRYDARCQTACQSDDEPETANLMSYYTQCRHLFSPEQVALMQHTLALRRGWQRCLGGACPCELGASGCPAEMSCRLLGNGARCTLDGPLPAGADCGYADDCGQDALCLLETSRNLSRCVRPCRTSREGCTCAGTEEGPSICLEDLE